MGRASTRAFDAAEAAFGGVDVLIKNAGITQRDKIADALFDRHIAVGLKLESYVFMPRQRLPSKR